MSLIEVVLSGDPWWSLRLIAMGPNLQYGVACIFNPAYGEFSAPCVCRVLDVHALHPSTRSSACCCPCRSTFGANCWSSLPQLPLVRRARTRDDLEGDTILATSDCCLLLKLRGELVFTADHRFYNYLDTPGAHHRLHLSPPTAYWLLWRRLPRSGGGDSLILKLCTRFEVS